MQDEGITAKIANNSLDETEIKKLLLRCLKRHYGELGPDAIVNPDAAVSDLHQIKAITDKWV